MKLDDIPPEFAGLRMPPSSVEAEQHVLGALLLDNAALDRVGDILSAGDFYRHDNRLAFEAIAALVNANKPADLLTVMERLKSVGKLDEAGGIPYLAALSSAVASAANVRRYAEIVREKAILRALVAASDEVATLAYNPQEKSAVEVLDHAQGLVLRVAEQGRHAVDEWESVTDGAVKFIDNLSELHEGKRPDVIPTGIAKLDEKMDGGARPGEVVTIGMRSGVGKSAFGLTVIANAASAGEPCAMFSMEMPKSQCNQRMVAGKARVHLSKLKRPERLTNHDWGRISEAVEWLGRANVHFNDRGSLNINQIRAAARGLKRRHGLRLLVVDHAGLTRGTDQKTLRTYQIAEVTSGLKSLAKELGCVVYLLVQINRQADARPDAMPQLADIRDASSIEDDSDVVIFGHREFKNKPDLGEDWRYYGELSIAKQRDGELGRIPVQFVGENMRWCDWPAGTPIPMSRTRTKGSKEAFE